MSLEARIELLTSAVIELTAAIGGMQDAKFGYKKMEEIEAVQLEAYVAGQDSIVRELETAPLATASIKIEDLPNEGGLKSPVISISSEFTVPENVDLRLNPINKIEDLPNEQSQSTPPTSQISAEESKPVAYSDVAKLVTSIAKTNILKAKAALARLGVKHGKELTEAQWPEAVTYLTRVAAGEVDPEASHA